MSPETYYEILGIGENADDDAVKQAFRDLAKHYHPDRNPNDHEAEQQFKRINTAYEGLKDASRRQAYSEWLEFAERRDKVKRTQWGRLAALVFLLLLGPSAVLYWAVVIADIPLFADSTDKVAVSNPHRETSLPPPRPEKRQPFSPSESAAPEQRTASPSQPAPQAGDPPQATEPPSVSAGGSPPAPATAVDNRPQADRPSAVTPPQPNRIAANAERNPPAPTGSASLPAKNGGSEAEKTYTQALPAPSSLAETVGVPETDEPAGDAGNSSPAPDSDRRQGAAPQGDGARATARMLARLKEPQGAQPSTAVPSEPLPPARENTAPRLRDGLPPDAFADCDDCPLVSIAGSNEVLGGTARAAVSLSEITLADWDGCVADRACRPIELPARATRRETIVEVSPRDAEAYVGWLSVASGKSYRQIMSPPRREATVQRCNSARRNSSGWEWLEDNSARDCPPPSALETRSDGPRSFRVFRKMGP